jgi:hypothetical protein
MYAWAICVVLSGVMPRRFGASKIEVRLERFAMPMTATRKPLASNTWYGSKTVPRGEAPGIVGSSSW